MMNDDRGRGEGGERDGGEWLVERWERDSARMRRGKAEREREIRVIERRWAMGEIDKNKKQERQDDER